MFLRTPHLRYKQLNMTNSSQLCALTKIYHSSIQNLKNLAETTKMDIKRFITQVYHKNSILNTKIYHSSIQNLRQILVYPSRLIQLKRFDSDSKTIEHACIITNIHTCREDIITNIYIINAESQLHTCIIKKYSHQFSCFVINI